MKTETLTNFKNYLEKRLSIYEILELEYEVEIEFELLKNGVKL